MDAPSDDLAGLSAREAGARPSADPAWRTAAATVPDDARLLDGRPIPPGMPEVDAPGDVVRRAVASVDAHSCRLVDFDETLLLRNSTEAYLRSARPRLLAVALLAVLNVLKPWRLSGHPRAEFLYRDWLRVLAVTVLLPWTLPRWRRIAPALGRQWRNDDLLAALGPGAPVQVVTFGFRPVVEPLLRGAAPDARLTVAAGLLDGYRTRMAGKEGAVRDAIGAETLSRALVVTDSVDDQDLLDACRTPVLVTWPNVRHVNASSGAYLPFLYTRMGKRQGEKYLLHNVLLEDVVVLWLAFAWHTQRPLVVALGLLLLHMSFWLVYEIGYHENDTLAVRRERNPKHPPGAALYAGRMHVGSAWACAVVLGVPGSALLVLGAGDRLRPAAAVDLGTLPLIGVVVLCWVAYLLAARGVYWLYNRIPAERRGFPYAALQLARTAGYGVLLVTNVAGVVIVTSLVLARWIDYLVYRDLGVHLRASHRLTMVLAFVVLVLIQLAADPADVLTLQTAVAFAYLAARAHRPLRALVARGA